MSIPPDSAELSEDSRDKAAGGAGCVLLQAGLVVGLGVSYCFL